MEYLFLAAFFYGASKAVTGTAKALGNYRARRQCERNQPPPPPTRCEREQALTREYQERIALLDRSALPEDEKQALRNWALDKYTTQLSELS